VTDPSLSKPIPFRTDPNARESELGPQLIARVYGVLRGVRLYDSSNETLQRQFQDLLTVLALLMDDGVTLVGMGAYFYLNGVRLKPDPLQIALYRSLIAEFEGRALGGLRFLPGLTRNELETFLRLFLAARDPARGEHLPEEAQGLGILHVVPIRARDLSLPEQGGETVEERDAAGERERAQRTFWQAIQGTRKLVMRTAQTGRPALQQARRLVQPVVDTIMKNEYSIVGLTALKDHDEYTYAHCVNVSVLSIRMGQILGLSRQALANLGVAALLHDIGKIAVPVAVLRKPGTLSPEEWGHIRRHPIEGVKMICRMPGLSTLTLDAMRVSFQHHVNVDRSGYPRLSGGGSQATMPRIVAVADFFDAITSHRTYRQRAFTTFEGLQFMMGPERNHFDPAVLWALVNTVGLYPAGSVLQTNSSHLVLSLSPNPADLRRPYCRVLARPDGSTPDAGSPEIWAPMLSEESVARVLRPEEVPFPVSELLAA
jgi:HD-GYP domain-containing protein (c-di-GMP phosphodiesterase class II)